jgi:hypothetical protein
MDKQINTELKNNNNNIIKIFGVIIIIVGLYLYYIKTKVTDIVSVGTGITGGVTLPNSTAATTIPTKPIGVESVKTTAPLPPALTKYILFTKTVTHSGDIASFQVAEIVVTVLENGKQRTLNANDYSDAKCYDDCEKHGPARNAIDGKIDKTYAHASDANPRLIFTLKAPTQILNVTVYNRQDCCQDRLKGVILELLANDYAVIKKCTLDKSDKFVCTV